MARLKKYNIHKAICDTCDGNGYVKIIQKGTQDHVRQCWECDSEGEYYVYEPKVIQPNNNADNMADDVIKLH